MGAKDKTRTSGNPNAHGERADGATVTLENLVRAGPSWLSRRFDGGVTREPLDRLPDGVYTKADLKAALVAAGLVLADARRAAVVDYIRDCPGLFIERYGGGLYVARGRWGAEAFRAALVSQHRIEDPWAPADQIRVGYVRLNPLARNQSDSGEGGYYLSFVDGPGRGRFLATYWVSGEEE